METSFPQSNNKYLSTKDFQDNKMILTFVGWEKVGNEDDPSDRPNPKSWKDKLDYNLKYTYPEWAMDKAGEKRVGRDGEPYRNSNWDPDFPHGYTIKYLFEEGELKAGNMPIWRRFCQLGLKEGDQIEMYKTGQMLETKWFIRKLESLDTLVTRAGEVKHTEPKQSQDIPF